MGDAGVGSRSVKRRREREWLLAPSVDATMTRFESRAEMTRRNRSFLSVGGVARVLRGTVSSFECRVSNVECRVSKGMWRAGEMERRRSGETEILTAGDRGPSSPVPYDSERIAVLGMLFHRSETVAGCWQLRRPMRLAASEPDPTLSPIPTPIHPSTHPPLHTPILPSLHPSIPPARDRRERPGNLRTDGCRTGSVVSFPTIPPVL